MDLYVRVAWAPVNRGEKDPSNISGNLWLVRLHQTAEEAHAVGDIETAAAGVQRLMMLSTELRHMANQVTTSTAPPIEPVR